MKLSDLNSRKLTDQEYQEIKKLVYEYPTRNQYGFLADEQKALIDKVNKQYGEMNMEKYWDVQNGITCMGSDEGLVIYHCDVFQSVVCGLENRKQTEAEWD